MRIAYLCADPGVPVFGTKGASVHVQEVVRALLAEGHAVSLGCTRLGDDRPADLEAVPVRVDRRARRSAAETLARAATEGAAGADDVGDAARDDDAAARRDAADDVRDDADAHGLATAEPDAAAVAAAREQLVGEAADALADAAIADGCDLVYERYALFSTAGARVAAATGAPLVLEVNAPLIDEQRRHRVLADADGARAATVASLEAAAVVACVSEPVRRWVHDLHPGARTLVVPNGVDTRRFAPRADRSRSTRLRVGFVGTLKPWHGTDVLVRAFAAVARPDWELVLCGDGPQRPALERLAAELGVRGQTTFTGAVAPAQVPAVLRDLDVAVAPYPATGADDAYFSPLKLFEYLAAGVAVVASRTGQVPAVVEDGRTGLLVAPGASHELAAALERLDGDPQLRHRIGAAGRRQAVARHDWRGVVATVLSAAVGAEATA